MGPTEQKGEELKPRQNHSRGWGIRDVEDGGVGVTFKAVKWRE